MSPSTRDRDKVAARRKQVLEMRAAGATFAAIAKETGHKTPGAAAQDFGRAMKARRSELVSAGVDQLVLLELERLDTLERVTQNLLRSASSDGARHDPALSLRAIDRLLRISWRRSALFEQAGLGVPGVPVPAQPGRDDREEEDPFDEVEAARDRRRRAARG